MVVPDSSLFDALPKSYKHVFLVAAVASAASAITTAVLIYGPNAQAGPDLMAQAQLHTDGLYLYKRWVLFFHPQLAFVAALGLAFALFRKRPALVSIGMFYLFTWAVTEMTQQAFVIDALNQYWRPALLDATSDAERATYETLLTGFNAISDSQYFLLLFGFGAGSILFGIALWSTDPLGKAIAAALLAIGLLSILAFLGYYAGASAVTPVTSWVYGNLYGPVQIAARIAIGLWLWRAWSAAGHPGEAA